MPIVSEYLFDRKKYLPTVFEAFGEFIDIPIRRCTSQQTTKLVEVPGKKFGVPYQCAAEFCYIDEPIVDKSVEESITYRDCIPFKNTINVECVQLVKFQTWRVVPIEEAHEHCLVTVGYISSPECVSFSRYETYETDVDNGTKVFKSEDEWDFYTTCTITSERERLHNIPSMIKLYKERNGIPHTDRVVLSPTNRPKLVARRRRIYLKKT